MRSRALLALALLAGCGNYSTEDVRFLAAVPTTGMLRVTVPAPSEAPQALSACTIGTADVWIKAKATGDAINAGVGAVLWLADFIRSIEPTRRTADSRTWGPLDDRRHPGYEDRITLTRQYEGCDPGVSVCYVFALQARVKGQGDFQTILDAVFQGGSAENGHGSLQIHFATVRGLGMNDADSPGGEMDITYSRSGDPRSIDLQLLRPEAGLPEFDYKWRGYANGSGSFVYKLVDTAGDAATVDSRFDAAGEGRADVTYVSASPAFTANYSECWDATACVSWLYDVRNITNLCSPPRPQWCTLTPEPPPGSCAVQ